MAELARGVNARGEGGLACEGMAGKARALAVVLVRRGVGGRRRESEAETRFLRAEQLE